VEVYSAKKRPDPEWDPDQILFAEAENPMSNETAIFPETSPSR